jgi:hypothetical protein
MSGVLMAQLDFRLQGVPVSQTFYTKTASPPSTVHSGERLPDGMLNWPTPVLRTPPPQLDGSIGHYSTYQNVPLTPRISFFWGTTNRTWDLDGADKSDGRKVEYLPIRRNYSSPVRHPGAVLVEQIPRCLAGLETDSREG